jgi:hypothetical protein
MEANIAYKEVYGEQENKICQEIVDNFPAVGDFFQYLLVKIKEMVGI